MIENIYMTSLIHICQHEELQEGLRNEDRIFLKNFYARWLDNRITQLEEEKNEEKKQFPV
jgi:hypothetical protein